VRASAIPNMQAWIRGAAAKSASAENYQNDIRNIDFIWVGRFAFHAMH